MEFLQLLLYGFVLGSIVALGAVGVTLTFGILGFANFAHGDLMTFGAYIALVVYTWLAYPLWLAFPVAIAATVLLAVLIDQVIFRRFRARRPIVLLISSFGVALILRALVQMIFGPGTVLYATKLQIAERFWGLRVKPDQILIIALALALVAALHLFLSRTKTGKAMRAMADNPDLARLSGIDTERVIVWTWAIGGALAAVAGIMLGLNSRLSPEMGWFLLLAVFAATIVGGIGKPYGAILGGYLIGVCTEVSTILLPTEYSPVVPFAILVLMLVWRPTGLFAGRST